MHFGRPLAPLLAAGARKCVRLGVVLLGLGPLRSVVAAAGARKCVRLGVVLLIEPDTHVFVDVTFLGRGSVYTASHKNVLDAQVE